jgi:hypothetical protein
MRKAVTVRGLGRVSTVSQAWHLVFLTVRAGAEHRPDGAGFMFSGLTGHQVTGLRHRTNEQGTAGNSGNDGGNRPRNPVRSLAVDPHLTSCGSCRWWVECVQQSQSCPSALRAKRPCKHPKSLAIIILRTIRRMRGRGRLRPSGHQPDSPSPSPSPPHSYPPSHAHRPPHLPSWRADAPGAHDVCARRRDRCPFPSAGRAPAPSVLSAAAGCRLPVADGRGPPSPTEASGPFSSG